MLAFSSDIDGSSYKRHISYKSLFDRYNIPFSDTFWFYNSAYNANSIESDTISYFKGETNKENYKKTILAGIESGMFDALHTYGNWSEGFTDFNREFALRALYELD